MSTIKRFVSEDQGLETVEYAIILGLIVVAVIGSVAAIGGWVSGRFQSLQTGLGV